MVKRTTEHCDVCGALVGAGQGLRVSQREFSMQNERTSLYGHEMPLRMRVRSGGCDPADLDLEVVCGTRCLVQAFGDLARQAAAASAQAGEPR